MKNTIRLFTILYSQATRKIKRIFKRVPIFLKYKYYFLFGSIILSIIIVLALSLSFVSRSRVELLAFKNEVMLGGQCHEECRRLRQLQKEDIANALQYDEALLSDYKKYFAEATVDDSNHHLLRQELLQIANLLPDPEIIIDYFLDYLVREDSSETVRVDIIRYLLANIYDTNLTTYYFAILQSSSSEALKYEALRALSLLPQKNIYMKEDQIRILKSLVLDDDLAPKLKMDTIFFLSDYRPYFTSKLIEVLAEIYAQAKEHPLQYMAATFLNELDTVDYKLPEVNDNEWLPYF